MRDDVRTGAAEARWKSEEAAREQEPSICIHLSLSLYIYIYMYVLTCFI